MSRGNRFCKLFVDSQVSDVDKVAATRGKTIAGIVQSTRCFPICFWEDLNKFLLLGQNICLDLIDLPRIQHKAIDSCEAPRTLVTTAQPKPPP